MKPTIPLLTALFALLFLGVHAARCEDDNSINQRSSNTADKSSSLVEAETSFDKGKITISVKVEADPDPTSVRFFLDTDADSSTGFRPAWHKGGGEGANFMVEDGALSKWMGGDSQQGWNWELVDSVGPVTAETPGEYQVSVAIPLSALKVKEGDTIHIFAVTGGANGDKPLDSIPRNSSWSVTIPPSAIDKQIQ